MKLSIELTDSQVNAVKSYHTELDEPTSKSAINDTIQEWVNGLFEMPECALSSHYKDNQ